jgi:nucleotide-binding universal stress UspA family protein
MFRRILVPTDFSAPSDAALDYARQLAEKVGASVHLLHIVEESFVTGPLASEMGVGESGRTIAALMKDAQTRLSHRVTADDRAHRRMTSEVVGGSSASTIVDYAAENGFDLIVMGTHGRRGMAHLMMGSVAERVVRTAPCPVMTVRTAPAKVRSTTFTDVVCVRSA